MTAAVVGMVAHLVAAQPGPAAIVIGNGLALSSTAVVLQVSPNTCFVGFSQGGWYKNEKSLCCLYLTQCADAEALKLWLTTSLSQPWMSPLKTWNMFTLI